jgi:hypothetical protein
MNNVIAGQRFRDAAPTVFGHAAPEWVIAEVFTGIDGIRYARIHSASNPHNLKTLSIAILRDKRRFVQVQQRTVDLV